VHRVLLNCYTPILAEIAADMFIVVPWDVNYFSAFSTLAKEFLDDIIVFLGPIYTPLQRGNVDDVPNKVQRFKVVLSKEIQQRFGLADFVAEVNIRNPPCSPV
jgi:hypothetical protein